MDNRKKKIKDIKDKELQELFARMEALNDLLMETLKEDYLRGDFGDDYDEDAMLERLASGKKIKKGMKTGEINYDKINELLYPKKNK